MAKKLKTMAGWIFAVSVFVQLIMIIFLTGSQYADLFEADRMAKANLATLVQTASK